MSAVDKNIPDLDELVTDLQAADKIEVYSDSLKENRYKLFSLLKAQIIDGLITESQWNQNGFVDPDDSVITFAGALRTFAIDKQAPATEFEFYQAGVSYTSTGDTKQISDVEGVHVLYYDLGVLSEIANPTEAQMADLIINKCIVSIIYWDVSGLDEIYFGDERHGISMAPATHNYEHWENGLVYRSGLGLVSFSVDGTGATADAQFGVEAGGVADEDYYHAISAIASTAGLPIYYMLGLGAEWQKEINVGFSAVTQDGTNATRLAYNEYTGGAWQKTEVTSGKFCLYHIFATNDRNKPVISVMGQNEYNNKPDAQSGALTEVSSLILNDILFPEVKWIGTIIYQTNLSYANDINSRIVSTEDGANYVDGRKDTSTRLSLSTSDHNSLINLLLAQAGVTFGHINDQEQTIAGRKIFSDEIEAKNISLEEVSLAPSSVTDKSTMYAVQNDPGLNGRALYHFDDGNGATTAADQFGVINITDAGAAAETTLDQKFGTTSLNCTGAANSRFYSAQSNQFNFTGAFTVDFWFKPTDTVEGSIFGFFNGFNNRFQVMVSTTGQVKVGADSSPGSYSAATPFTQNVWHHVELVIEAASGGNKYINVYVDGVFVYYRDLNGYLTESGTHAITIGGADTAWGTAVKKGLYDELFIREGEAHSTDFTPPETAYEGVTIIVKTSEGEEIRLAGGVANGMPFPSRYKMAMTFPGEYTIAAGETKHVYLSYPANAGSFVGIEAFDLASDLAGDTVTIEPQINGSPLVATDLKLTLQSGAYSAAKYKLPGQSGYTHAGEVRIGVTITGGASITGTRNIIFVLKTVEN